MGARLMWDRGLLATSVWGAPGRYGRYLSSRAPMRGCRVRRLGLATRVGAVVALAGALTACSTGGGSSSDLGSGTQPQNNRVLCSLIGQLPDTAGLLQRVDVR